MTLWLIGGFDPTGGAGVLRDVATARTFAPELPTVTLISAMTQQGDGRPARAEPTPPRELAAALAPLAGDRSPVVKLGVVPDALVDLLIEALVASRATCVLDPVLRASDGGALGASVPGLLRLARVVDLVTPNREETTALFGNAHADVVTQARASCRAVLFKDARGEDATVVCDRLVHPGGERWFRRPRRAGPDPRGTGCALATAIACGLRRGVALPDACAAAIEWLDAQRGRARPGPDGRDHLPDD